ncbi:MAG: amino acid permease [Acidobacteriota bacterium]
MTSDSPTPSEPTAEGGLRRQLGFPDGLAHFLGTIIGSGIFFAPGFVAAVTPTAGWSVVPWLLGAAAACCGALCYAECGARLPRAGGFFVYLEEALGPAVAQVAAWLGLLITYPASAAGIAWGCALALGQLGVTLWPPVLAMGAIVLAAALNALHVRTAAWSLRLLSTGKLLGLALPILVGVWWGSSEVNAEAQFLPATVGATAWFSCLSLVLWSLDGWSDITLLAGELREPRRQLPRIVITGIYLLALTYAAVQVSVFRLLPASELASADLPVAAAVEAGLGEGAGRLLAILAAVSTFGALTALLMSYPRLTWRLSRDGLLPTALSRVGADGTPGRAVMVSAGLALVYALHSSFNELVSLFTIAIWFFYSLTTFGLLRLRARNVGEPGWSAPVLAPAVVFLTTAAISVATFRYAPQKALAGLAVLAAAALIQWYRFRGR